MKIGGNTKIFAVLGHPVRHTLSPTMHNAALQVLGLNAVYVAFDVHPDRLVSALHAMADMGLGGVNITVPLKEVAFEGLSDLDDSARKLRAVNTVEFLPTGPRGHNTDGKGFLHAVRESFDTSVAGLSVFVLGCGGAGRAVAITCATEKAKRLAIADIDGKRVSRVAQEIGKLEPDVAVVDAGSDPGKWTEEAHKSDLVVQATPIGMKPDEASPLDRGAFHKGQIAYDLIYMRPETPFMKEACAAGARTANGLGMLLHQGAGALSIWTGRPAPVEIMRVALERAVYGEK